MVGRGRWRRFPVGLSAMLLVLAVPGNQASIAAPAPHSGWNIVASPSPGAGDDMLNDVVGLSRNLAWGVGFAGPDALIEAWNGSAWSVANLPDLAGPSALNGVDALPSGEVWAAGAVGNRTLILRGQDSSWELVPSPNIAGVSNTLYAVSADSTDDVWAVGRAGKGLLIEHWNGERWRVVPPPRVRRPGVLTSVFAMPSGTVWAVGAERRRGYFSTNAFSLRWTGTRWIRRPVPLPKTPWAPQVQKSRLEDVSVAGEELWAGGWWTPDPGSSGPAPYAWHWFGGAWHRTRVPSGSTESCTLVGIGGQAANSIWSVGQAGGRPFAVRWDGAHWGIESVPNPDPPVGHGWLQAVDTSGGVDWAVGSWVRRDQTLQTLILRYVR